MPAKNFHRDLTIAALRICKVPTKEIARRFGLSVGRVRKIFRKRFS